ncbi:MAG: ribonuclease HII [Candidatus Binatia bacterium]|nr:ribonuclease HII [Candidatus Binatia bacterium]
MRFRRLAEGSIATKGRVAVAETTKRKTVAVKRKRRPHPSPEEMLVRERELWASGLEHIAGIDEVGIGPLAGPVVAAAVVLPRDSEIEGVRDSKTLSRKQRERLDGEIRAIALGIGVGVVSPDEVDQLNPYQAGIRAMQLAVRSLPENPDHLLIDARKLPGIDTPQTSIVKGDRHVRAIAAASIIAKVHRDGLMQRIDEDYPGYGFARHVGYATVAHLEALRRLGPCPIHRRSYAPVRALLGRMPPMDDTPRGN